MNKLLLLLIIFLFGCTSPLTPNEIYQKYDIFEVDYKDTPGIVMITTGFGKSELCTGVAVSQYAILTAAHCLYFPKEVLSIKYDCNNVEDKSCKLALIKDIVIHDESLINDIAIIKTDCLNIERLPDIPEFNIRPSALFVAGYGRKPHRESGKLFAMVGQNPKYTNWSNRFSIEIERGKGLCLGDSGGPAYDWSSEKLVGILSRSWVRKEHAKDHKCGGLLKYMYIPHYRDWIKAQLY